MADSPGPLLTLPVYQALCAARAAGQDSVECSLDLGVSRTMVATGPASWAWQGRDYPYPEACKERTVYHWTGSAFAPVSRYQGALIKLVPTDWGMPVFEIDGIKMLVSAEVSPYADAERKVGLIQPAGKRILDCCGGLGYFAVWALRGGATQIVSCEKNPDVIWLRRLNPWSPEGGATAPDARLELRQADVTQVITGLPDQSFDAVLHDPPRFGIAGELYAQVFYDQLARVLKRGGRLFHYTGTPNKLTSRRDLPREVSVRLERAGFATEIVGDGVLAILRGGAARR
ncbi:MAG TPA: methyltransferase domain-containing protein [Solimonas sp.]|nr:methyltransferase domain-containing protein [Solimonas sp.]